MNEKLICIRGCKTQIEFADELDITPQWLSKLENGKCKISRKLSKRLSKTYGNTPNYWRE